MSKEKGKTQNKKRKLTRQEKKQIDALIRQSKGDGKPHTAQDSIPFERMYKDGICRLANGRYSKCIEFEDINYQLAQPDDKTAIFEALCDMYNSFDASISVQLSLISRHANKEDFKSSITIAPQNDDFDSIRAEYTEMLQTQLERGNNGLIKTKFLTFTIEAKDIKSARARLARIETDTLNHFKVIGAAARVLDGKQRLEVLHGLFHPDGERFNFAWEWLPVSGLSVKDFIAPSSFRFGDGRMFQMGGKFGAVSFLQIAAPELSDRMLADFMEAENGIVVNLHIQSIDHNEAIKTIKRKITDLDRMKIEEQKKAIRSGYDMDIIPSDLATYGGEAKNLLRDLQSRNERMFLLTLLVLNVADTKQKLDNDVFQAASIAQKYNCMLTRLDYRQEQGLMSSIPLGENLIQIQRGLTTSSTAIFVPFTVQELFQSGEALYYGLNALSNNMILCDRKRLKNPNGLILGTPGSGKSFSAKREITNAFLITADDIIICDPEAEYYPLVERLKGQVIKVSQNSTQYINPMDINLNYSEGDTPIALKSDFILSFCELIMGGKNGLEAVEKTLIDRAVISVYRSYLADPKPENMPILGDLYNEIKKQPEKEAQRIASALELYVNGSLNVFNHQTNVDIHNRLETIQTTAKELITEIEGHFTELQQQRQAEQEQGDTFSIYQLKRGDETRDLRFEPYDRLQAAGLTIDRVNYELVYTAPLTKDMTLGDIWERFNIDHPADFKGHSLSVSDIVVLHQNDEDTAHYVDSIGFQQVPEFLQEQQTPVFDKLPPEQQQALSDTVQDTLQMLVDADKRIYGDVTGKTLEAIAAQGYSYKDGQLEKQQPEATPDSLLTGETVRTPRGNFHITDMSREQIEAAGFGFHHASEDGKYLIMGNGTQAYAIAAEQPQRDNPLKHVEDTIEQNDNNFDGLINNTPQTPTVADFEQRAKAGEAISVTDLAKAVKAEKREQPQKKPSILKKLDEYKKQAAQQPKDKQKEHKKDLEV